MGGRGAPSARKARTGEIPLWAQKCWGDWGGEQSSVGRALALRRTLGTILPRAACLAKAVRFTGVFIHRPSGSTPWSLASFYASGPPGACESGRLAWEIES